MITLRDAYRTILSTLRGRVADPEFSARYLVAHVAGCDLKNLPLAWDMPLSRRQARKLSHLASRHARGVPLAYLVGYVDFYGRRFTIRPGVLIPRPDTEHILYAIEELKQPFTRILDIGTGSGILAISLGFVFPEASIHACDLSLRALWIARHNARTHQRPITLHWGNFLTHPPRGNYDLIVSNPPYIARRDTHLIDPHTLRYEPHLALFGGEDGLVLYRAIARYASTHLEDHGLIVVETDHKYAAVMDLFAEYGFTSILRYDYQHLPRVIIASRSPDHLHPPTPQAEK